MSAPRINIERGEVETTCILSYSKISNENTHHVPPPLPSSPASNSHNTLDGSSIQPDSGRLAKPRPAALSERTSISPLPPAKSCLKPLRAPPKHCVHCSFSRNGLVYRDSRLEIRPWKRFSPRKSSSRHRRSTANQQLRAHHIVECTCRCGSVPCIRSIRRSEGSSR